MALFHRKDQQQSEALFTLGTSFSDANAKLVVGLGNPEARYDLTRHNIGFYCTDRLVEAESGTWSLKKSLKCNITDIKVGSIRLIVCKPTTYMNLSGEAVRAVQDYFKIDNASTLVIHDDLDIDFGQIRTRVGGGSAGHNGIKSLVSHLGEDFGRIRVGIGNKFSDKVDSADFVLQKFSKTEQESLKLLSNEAISIINEAIFGGTLITETRSFL